MTVSSTGTLSSYFTSLITNIMTVESQPLKRAQTARDQITVRRNLFNQVNTKLKDLQASVKALLSTDASYAFESGRTTKVTAPSGSTVLTATAGSAAVVGNYAITVNSLAAVHRVNGDAQTAANTALGYAGSFTLNGVAIDVEANDTLIDVANNINNATYADGKAVRASIVDKRLVLENEYGGEGNTIAAADVSGGILQGLGVLAAGGAFAHVLQTPTTASLTVNGLTLTRDHNSGLTDVVNGLTINLAADGLGKTAEISVGSDSTPEKTAVNDFITKFNSLQTYLTQQLQRTGTAITCDIFDPANTCWQDIDLMVIGGGNYDPVVVQKQLATYMAAGKAVLILPSYWNDSERVRPVLSALGMAPGGYPGNYFSSSAELSITADRTPAQTLTAIDPWQPIVQSLTALAATSAPITPIPTITMLAPARRSCAIGCLLAISVMALSSSSRCLASMTASSEMTRWASALSE